MAACSQVGSFLLGLLSAALGLIALVEQPIEVASPFIVGGIILAWTGRKALVSGP